MISLGVARKYLTTSLERLMDLLRNYFTVFSTYKNVINFVNLKNLFRGEGRGISGRLVHFSDYVSYLVNLSNNL